jgi:H+/Cl- antiporter ClcA
MKPKIREILFGAFAVFCIPVGFAIHGWPSLCFLMIGIICGAFALYFTLLNHRVHSVTESQARKWALLFLQFFP